MNPGTRLAEYEVVNLIAVGGMGEVYRARDTKLVREAAIKVLPEAFAEDRERLTRFEREAGILASLNHSNIAAVYGLEESEGVHFLAMELVPGETLAERLSRGPIPHKGSVDIFKQIADALEAAHEAGIVHRDLKPANIKITPNGIVKVLDFGLAKALRDEAAADAVSSESCASPKSEPTCIEYVGDVGPPREKELPRALPRSILVPCFV
jgi:serine/threonine protein kinase